MKDLSGLSLFIWMNGDVVLDEKQRRPVIVNQYRRWD